MHDAAVGDNLILWRKDGLVHAVVSDRDAKELKSMFQIDGKKVGR